MSVIDLLKLLLSKDSRETVGFVLKKLRSAPEWRKDVVLLQEKFTRKQKLQIPVLVSHVVDLLSGKGWEYEDIQTAKFMLSELTDHAFEHGIQASPKAAVTVRVQASSDFIEMVVSDPGKGFDLQTEMETQQAADPHSQSCRALGFIYRWANELTQETDPHAMRAYFRRQHKPCVVTRNGDCVTFGFQGETQPSGYFWAQIVNEIENLPENVGVVLDFSHVTTSQPG